MKRPNEENLNRRQIIKRTGFAGVGFATLSQQEFGQLEKKGSLHLVEAGLEYQVNLPDSVSESLSIFNADVRPRHAVDRAGDRVRPSEYATDKEKSKLKTNEKLLWLSDGYQPLTSGPVEVAEQDWLSTSLSGNFRPVAGIDVVDSYQPPQFSINVGDESIVVSTETTDQTVTAGSTAELELDPRTVDVRAYKQTKTAVPEMKQVSITTTPKLKIRNNGALELYEQTY